MDGGSQELDAGPSDGSAADIPGLDIPNVDELTPANWVGLWSDALCSLFARCAWPGSPWDSFDECRASITQGLWEGRYLPEAVSTGQAAFDAQAARDCLTGLQAFPCADLLAHLSSRPGLAVEACQDVLSGTAGEGDACFLGIECAAGLHCVFGQSCPGHCQPFVQVGGACDFESWCDLDEAFCLEGCCQLLPAEVGASCSETGMCMAPLGCSPETQTCRAASLQGQPCGPEEGHCLTGLICFAAGPSEAGTCQPLRKRSESCFNDSQCSAKGEEGLLVCVGGFCDIAPGPEEPCYGFLCNGAWCDTSSITPTCKALPTRGEACALGALCGRGLRCDQGLCVPVLDAGEACTSPAQCEDGRCFGGRCVAAGEPPCTP